MIFGREPQAVAGLLSGALVLLAAFVLPFSEAQVDVLVVTISAVTALVGALMVREVPLAVVTGAVKAVVAALVAFGSDLSAEQVAVLLAFSETAYHFLTRAQVSPRPASG